jgi:hypothetical protein
MKAKGIIVPCLLLAMGLSLTIGLSFAAQQKDKKQEKIFIPKEVSTLIKEGLDSRQGRQDIPVNVFRTLYLPAKENFQAIFLINIKNSALGFAPAASALPGTDAAKRGPQETTTQAAGEILQAGFNVFLQFNRLNESGEPSVFREVYVPATIQVPAAGFDPEKEDLYGVGYPLPSGHYLLALAVTSLDLKTVGIAYHDFTIPDPSEFTKALDTTPVFFVKQMDQMEAVEQRTVFHRGLFTYSVLKVVPNLDNTFGPGENLDIFFYIFGAKPNSSQQYDIEIDFEIKQGEQSSIKWSPQTYNSPLISQPLPMKQTVRIKKGDEPERIEQRDLPAGSYTLVISVLDKTSQNSVVKTLDIAVK